ncbi:MULTISPECIES: DUF982 domain-containing protein [unclassified Rhizobium]|nr:MULTISPECIES: DUF982 domain-containing protein [unclassified Rhizobium]MBX5168541.1 DUF982 domain-containing protein [Rhizobium sp. NZLR1b]MBX5187807.1 DUF982 domain-containing protein [Rhizobium sp. NZLR3b]MBX5194188.1 DUF982 domain-containing protein [Rhizobium sp. NZLR10]MBX5166350.1 DUF982 domain-containing protein [Rhizobium sp. NZLR4b]MBX5181851.1 DUF982 domain-containing protein [Rhizobium sp. NZLR5]
MRRDFWDQPVEVIIGDGDHLKSIRSSRDALAYLMTCWPRERAASFAVAKRICTDAVDGRADPSAAALAFKVAAEEAGVLHR